MALRSRIRKLFVPKSRAIRRSSARLRPRIETLDARTLLTGYTAASVSELIDAIDQSNTAGGTNTITLTSDDFPLIAVNNNKDGANGLPVIAAGSDLTIVGISGVSLIERFENPATPAFRLFDVSQGATLTLRNLALFNGLASGKGAGAQGGAIRSEGKLTLDTVRIEHSTARGDRGGDSLSGRNDGVLAYGGGLYVGQGEVALTNVVFAFNTAKGGDGGSVNSLFLGGDKANGGGAYGGGLYMRADGNGTSVDMGSVTFVDNVAQGGVGGITNSTGDAGGEAFGGALCADQGAVNLTNVTLDGNTAHGGSGGNAQGLNTNDGSGGQAYGGGVYTGAQSNSRLINVTLTGNTAQGGDGGGGDAARGGVARGGGLYVGTDAGAYVAVGNTLIATNTVTANAGRPAEGPDVYGNVSGSNNNLIGDGSSSNLSDGTNGNLVGTNASPIDPKLGALTSVGLSRNGYRALLLGSPAIDAGYNASDLPAADQRGAPFARVSGSAVDIGAYERQYPVLGDLPNGAYATAYSQTITVTEGVSISPSSIAVTAGKLPPGLSLAADGVLSGVPTAAGSYSFTITATDGEGFTGSKSYTIAIGQRTLRVTADVLTKVYGAADPPLTYTVTTADLKNGDTSSVLSGSLSRTAGETVRGGPYSIEKGTLTVSNYQLVFTTGKFTITKATPTVSVSRAGGTYSGDAFAATATVAGVRSGVDDSPAGTLEGFGLTLIYYAGTFTSSNLPSSGGSTAAPTKAGSYTVVASFPGSDDYNSARSFATFTIAKAAAVITVSPYSITYDGDANAATGSAIGVKGESLEGLNLGGTSHTNAGVYAADAWTFADATGNYVNAVGTVGNVVAKAPAAITITLYGVVYDGNAHAATGSAIGVKGESLAGLNLGGTSHTNAGAYADAWTFTDATGNYINAGGVVNNAIAKAAAVITVVPYSVAYDGNGHAATGSAIGVKGESLAGLNLGGTSHTNAGVYADAWTFTDATGNYVNAGGAVSNTIARVAPTIGVSAGPVVVIGNGVALTAAAVLNGSVNATGSVTFTLYGPNNSVVETETVACTGDGKYATPRGYVPTVAGTYQWVAGYGGDGNNASVGSAVGAAPEVAVGAGSTVVGSALYLVGGNTNDQINITPYGSSASGSTGIKVGASLNSLAVNQSYSQSFSTIYVFGFNGNDKVQMDARLDVPAIVNEGNGSDVIQLANGNNVVVVGNGSGDQITVGHGNNVITAGDGPKLSITAGDGNNTIAAGNGGATIKAGSGNNVIVAGSGNDTIQVGDGSNLLVGGLGKDSLKAGNGRNILIDGIVQLTQAGDSLSSVLADWAAFGSSASNVAGIRSRLKVTYNTVNSNTLNVGNGLNWFWAVYAQDRTNRKSTDLLN